MKITLITMETPYPPLHGGRVDIWRRIKALSAQGVKIQLISWAKTLPSQADKEVIQQYVADFQPLTYEQGPLAFLQRLLHLLRYPLQVSSRIPAQSTLTRLLAKAKLFSPDFVLLDQVDGCVVAQTLSRQLEVPLIFRSHNIEHQYHRKLLAESRGLQKIKGYLALHQVEACELSVLHHSYRFYDISKDDLKYWSARGFENGRYLPCLIDLHEEQQRYATVSGEPTYTAAFLGNLCTANNIAGVFWFLEEVLPILETHLPEVQILIAGSKPTTAVIEKCRQYPQVTLRANPDSVFEIYRTAQVLINPVYSGSGTSTKSIDMLATGKPIVTRSKGLFGIPEEVWHLFVIAENPPAFATAISQAAQASQKDPLRLRNLQLLEELFGFSCIKTMVHDLEAALPTQRKQPTPTALQQLTGSS